MNMSSSPVLTIRDLQTGYGNNPVIKNLTLSPVRSGVVALIGPNGAGKSTLLRALAQLISARGEISLNDVDLMHMKPALRAATIGFMPQNLPENVSLSVLETVIATLKASDNGSTRHIEKRAYDVLVQLGVADLALHSLNRLSGGQRQVVSLAQAIAGEPALLLLDEPTSALDLARQFLIMKHVQNYASTGRIVVVVLHDLALAAQWADQIVVLAQGGLYSSGTPEDIITPQMLADVYHIEARVECCTRGQIRIMVDGAAQVISGQNSPVVSENHTK